MEQSYNLLLILFFFIIFFFSASDPVNGFTLPNPGHIVKPPATAEDQIPEGLHTYIVRVSGNPSASVEDKKWYNSFLPGETGSVGDHPRLVYAYSNRFSAFAARLTKEELLAMKKKKGFLSAFPDRFVSLLTTHTPDYLGLNRQAAGFWKDADFGKGVIIGVMDTGILPTHPSFRDEEGIIPPPPAKWKGACEFEASDCNNKLIGARNFVKGSEAMGAKPTAAALQAPNDDEGHGTHTAGTAAGMFVDGANVDDQANGIAAGMAPYAHLAIYKVCSEEGCADSDILAAFDSAIGDGVDVLSLSLGKPSGPFYENGIAIGAFVAIANGIFVSCAAGNSGPSYFTLSNEAPWILTVGAGTMDRAMRTTVTLGSGDEYNGESLYQPEKFSSSQLPLVYPGLQGDPAAAICDDGSLDSFDLKGTIVVCDDGGLGREEKGQIVKSAGGAAIIIANAEDEGFITTPSAHVLPASHVGYSAGLAIKSYISSESSPTASLTLKGTVVGITPAPMVAYFSSRGPNQADPNILKPDIIGPGMNILAAWPFKVGTTDNGALTFNVISGTSMATPHLSGIAALLKATHPDWSPAAIKSAIMTTADMTSNDGNLITDQNTDPTNSFVFGAGQVNPSKANNPGLVYDINPDDYIAYLCGLGYTDDQVSVIANRVITCSDIKAVSGEELNYPSFMVSLTADNSYKVQVDRTVTNVGAPSSTYTVQVESPTGVSVKIDPEKFSFSKAGEQAQFSVTFTGASEGTGGAYQAGILTWSSTEQDITVNSPIMVFVE